MSASGMPASRSVRSLLLRATEFRRLEVRLPQRRWISCSTGRGPRDESFAVSGISLSLHIIEHQAAGWR